jgi:hypothetical protein
MTESEKRIYKAIARHIYDEADNVALGDLRAINLIAETASRLVPLDKKYEEKYAMGFMHEVSLWMGLKADAPEMAERYGEGIKTDYSDIFKD